MIGVDVLSGERGSTVAVAGRQGVGGAERGKRCGVLMAGFGPLGMFGKCG